MAEKIKIEKWDNPYGVSGAKRANIIRSEWLPDWFVGYGKDESCQFEGTWWDMICFARNVLASPNTKRCAPEFYRPEWKNDNYNGKEQPYEYVGKDVFLTREEAEQALEEGKGNSDVS